MFRQMISYYQLNGMYVLHQFLRHFLLSSYGVVMAAVVGIPVGFAVARKGKVSQVVLGFSSVLQTIPSLAMLAILMLGMGIGAKTVIMAVFLYSLLPIVANTITGVCQVGEDVLDAATGMGMSKWQRIYLVEFPLSISVILGGIRNALVVAIGVTAIGTFIGAGGLGDIIIHGISVADGEGIILAGALPTALMAILADILLGSLERYLLRQARKRASC